MDVHAWTDMADTMTIKSPVWMNFNAGVRDVRPVGGRHINSILWFDRTTQSTCFEGSLFVHSVEIVSGNLFTSDAQRDTIVLKFRNDARNIWHNW